jgi:SAM-dependent methyltransferase
VGAQLTTVGLKLSEIPREEGRRLFGIDPAGYDAARPGHPDRVYEVLSARCGLGSGTRVLEVGPGTGQATRRLLAEGADVVAIEPSSALADYLATAAPGALFVRHATLEEVELPGEAFDLAIAASSFHWVDEELGLPTVLAALRPGGWLALWWTLFGPDPDPFQEAFTEAVDAVCAGRGVEPARSPSSRGHDAPRFGLDVDARRGALEQAGFVRFEHELVAWTHRWDSAGIRALYGSFSPQLRLEPATRAAVLDAVHAVAERFGGCIELRLVTSLYTAQRPG